MTDNDEPTTTDQAAEHFARLFARLQTFNFDSTEETP